MDFNTMLTKNYSFFLDTAKNITKKYKKKNPDIAESLVHNIAILLIEKIDTVPHDEQEFRKYYVHLMNTNFKWDTYAYFKRGYSREYFSDTIDYYDLDGEDVQDELIDKNNADTLSEQRIYIQAENVNDVTKLYLEDLLSNDITIERGLMYDKIKIAGNMLSPIHKELFDLYYLQEMTGKDIYNYLKNRITPSIGYLRILEMIKDMKKQLIQLLKNDNIIN